MTAENERVVMTNCNSHCGGQCLLKVHVKDGVIRRIETENGEDPQLRPCLRGRAQRQRIYAPDRLLFPMKRVGARGEGKFERISWDEALDTVASELKRVRDTYGPGAILLRSGGGDISALHRRGPISRVLGLFGGYSQHWGSVSYEGGRYASLATFGTTLTRSSRDELLNSRLIILWGMNPAHTVQDVNTCWYIARAKESGIPVISIDPRYTDTTAALAHEWIPIRPGTDAAMLIAMAYVIITEKLQDQKFIDRYTVGFDQFKDYVLGKEDAVPKTPAWAEGITGVPAATTEDLARRYATMKPAALIAGIAPGRTAYGEQYHRAAHTLAVMTGNVGIHGGDAAGRCHTTVDGFSFMTLGPGMKIINPVDDDAPRRKYSLSGGGTGIREKGRVNTSQMADAILKGKAGGYPFDYKFFYIVSNNPVNQSPDTNKIIRAYDKLEFMVIQEQFITATARFADILLPVTTFLERNDVCIGEGVPFYGFQNKAVEPVGEARTQLEIATGLAMCLGFPDFNTRTEDEWLREMVKTSLVPDYDEFKRKGVYRPKNAERYVAFEKEVADPDHNPFPTPSGKIEIYSQRLADMKYDKLPPIPKYVETWESPNDPLARKYPLQLVTIHFKRRAHSQFETMPWLRELQPQTIEISPVDAEARGIRNGDRVRVFNHRGQMLITAELTERIMAGVVSMGQGAWYDPDENGVDRGGCANVLTSDAVSPGGAVPTNTCLVQVEKA